MSYSTRIENIKNHLVNNENEIQNKLKFDRVNIKDLKDLIDSPEEGKYKDAVRKLIDSNETFITDFTTLSPSEYKDVVFKQIKSVANSQVIRFTDIKSNIHRFCAGVEILSMYNNNIATKCGVHYSLFGGTVNLLGTKRHEKYIAPADTLQIAGCFAMTEIGHGSNVRGLETTATFNQSTQEFIINTPNPKAQKFWIGGAGLHAHYTTVFARLIMGTKDHGIHAFVVPIRDTNTNQILPGIRIRDCGQKLGLNGIDNGQIHFDHVHIPRENLLNRFSDVSADGVYSSAFPTPIKNFAATMAPFIGGRLVITKIAGGASKTCLAIAIKFSHMRKQFGPSEKNELPIITISTQRQRLIVPLARTILLDLYLHHIANILSLENPPASIHAHCSGIKAVYTWECIKTIQVCREACGGQGFRAANRISEFKSDCDVIVTYEGDNTVLMQQVAKYLLGLKPSTNIQLVTLTQESDFFNLPKILSLFKLRVELKLSQLRDLLKSSKQKESYFAFNELIPWANAAAHAYMETVIIDNAITCNNKKLVNPLPHFIYINILTRIQDDLAWFLANQLISIEVSKSIPFLIMDLSNQLTPHLLDIVEAFDIPKKCLPSDDLVSDLLN